MPRMQGTGRCRRKPEDPAGSTAPPLQPQTCALSWTICSSLLTSSPVYLPRGNQRFFYNMNLSPSLSSSQVDLCLYPDRNTFCSKMNPLGSSYTPSSSLPLTLGPVLAPLLPQAARCHLSEPVQTVFLAGSQGLEVPMLGPHSRATEAGLGTGFHSQQVHPRV